MRFASMRNSPLPCESYVPGAKMMYGPLRYKFIYRYIQTCTWVGNEKLENIESNNLFMRILCERTLGFYFGWEFASIPLWSNYFEFWVGNTTKSYGLEQWNTWWMDWCGISICDQSLNVRKLRNKWGYWDNITIFFTCTDTRTAKLHKICKINAHTVLNYSRPVFHEQHMQFISLKIELKSA